LAVVDCGKAAAIDSPSALRLDISKVDHEEALVKACASAIASGLEDLADLSGTGGAQVPRGCVRRGRRAGNDDSLRFAPWRDPCCRGASTLK